MSIRSAVLAILPPFLHRHVARVEASPLGYRLAKGVFWSMAGAVISRGLMFVATVLVARMLGKTIYGELGMIQSTVGMFGVFAGFGLGLTATKHVAEFRQSDPDRAGRIIGLSGLFAMVTGGLMALGLFIFAPWLAEHTINAPHLSGVLRIGALILFINALNGAQTGALAGFEAFKTIAYVNLFVGLISFPILVSGVYFGGLTGAVWALTINLCVNWLLNHVALRKEARRYSVPFTFRDCSREWSILWSFALPAALAGSMVGPVNWACGAFLVNQPDGYGEMGIFSATIVFRRITLLIVGNLNQPLLSMACNVQLGSEGNLERINILSTWVIGLIVSLPLICFPMFPELLFGSEYKGKGFRITFALVMAYTCIQLYKNGLSRVLVARSLMWLSVLSNLLWGIVMLAVSYWAVQWGAQGLAFSFLVAYLASALPIMLICKRAGLIPRNTLFSLRAVSIWGIICMLVVLAGISMSWVVRVPLFIVSVVAVSSAFYGLIRPIRTSPIHQYNNGQL